MWDPTQVCGGVRCVCVCATDGRDADSEQHKLGCGRWLSVGIDGVQACMQGVGWAARGRAGGRAGGRTGGRTGTRVFRTFMTSVLNPMRQEEPPFPPHTHIPRSCTCCVMSGMCWHAVDQGCGKWLNSTVSTVSESRTQWKQSVANDQVETNQGDTQTKESRSEIRTASAHGFQISARSRTFSVLDPAAGEIQDWWGRFHSRLLIVCRDPAGQTWLVCLKMRCHNSDCQSAKGPGTSLIR